VTASQPGADRIGEATVRRYLDPRNDVLVTLGDFGSLYAAYREHVRRWEAEPDGFSATLMRQGLGAAVLHLSSRPPGESVGWTIHVHRPATNLFLTGDSGEATVTGRVFTEGVRPSTASRMYVQSSRTRGGPSESTVDVQGVDILEMFEQYYERSEQLPARFFEVDDDRFLMVLALPEAEGEWVRSLTREAAVSLTDQDLKPLGEATYVFRCGCNLERMLDVVRGMFGDDPEDLFQGEGGVEIYCPRCGHRWWLDREAFEDVDDGTASDDDADGGASAGEAEAGGEPR